MKKLFTAILMVAVIFQITAQSSEGIQFETSAWADVLAKAKAREQVCFSGCIHNLVRTV